MARDIKLDQIRARLGDLDKPREYDPYNNADSWQDVENDDGGVVQGGSTINAGFIATILGLFIVISGGTYMFSEGINPLKGIDFSWGVKKASQAPAHTKSSADGGWDTTFTPFTD